MNWLEAKSTRKITKEAIFHYCYAVLHDLLYREKYAQNLKSEFPRIPFYKDFWQWAAGGEALPSVAAVTWIHGACHKAVIGALGSVAASMCGIGGAAVINRGRLSVATPTCS